MFYAMDDKGAMVWDAPPSSNHLTLKNAFRRNCLVEHGCCRYPGISGRSQALKSFKTNLIKLISFTHKISRISSTITISYISLYPWNTPCCLLPNKCPNYYEVNGNHKS